VNGGALNGLGALVLETLRDAVRRRGLIAAALVSAGVALFVQRCGTCDAAITVQGESTAVQGSEFGAIAALVSFGLVAVWTYGVIALLASDGLASVLDDGGAESILARPVSRDVFVTARLIGVWAGAFAIGFVLLALVVGLATANQDLPVAAALPAVLAVAIAALGVAAFAMLCSLSLPRVATLLLLTGVGLAVTGIESATALGGEPTGWMRIVAQWGPAWVMAPVAALGPWLPAGALPTASSWPFARACVWSGLLVVALVARFRRIELLR
jgi:ABC-type transport system involved in multi-copper enzyme maturation permease subunit